MGLSACLGESLGKDGQLPHEQKVQRHRLADLRPLHLHGDFAAAILLRQPCAIHLHNRRASHDARLQEYHMQIALQIPYAQLLSLMLRPLVDMRFWLPATSA